ncbi:MAG TPA: proton-conducting transporter membrane subunit, partial [Pseudoxanthomonas sp.]|nr:proton-conducting transporter membrane subunit [Pseudoxanthomonas sp.]
MTTTSLAMPTAAELLPLLPELVLIGSAFALLIVDLFIGERHKVWTHFLSVLALVVVLAMLATGVGGQGVVLSGMFVRDAAADVMKIAIVLMSTLTLVYGWSYLRERRLYKGEIPVLILFATAGMMMLVSAGSLLMVYLGLELLALCSYALVAADRDNGKATEAAMKYIVLGSLASGLLLYGMSLIYGATGSLHL